MDNYFDTNQQTTIVVSESLRSNLKSVASWSKFIAILGFVCIGMLVLGSLFMMFSGSVLSMAQTDFVGSATFITAGIMYMLIAAFYFFPIRFLYKFSTRTEMFLLNNTQFDFEEAIENLKSHYKFIGIFTLVTLALYLLMIIGVVIAATAGAIH